MPGVWSASLRRRRPKRLPGASGNPAPSVGASALDPFGLATRSVITILHASDVHFGKPYDPTVGEAFQALAREVPADLIVVSGDFTQRAKVHEYAEARAWLDRLPRVPLVVTPGNHDDGEDAGDSRFAAFREISQNVMSPTINLKESAPGVYNSMGIRGSIAAASDDILIWYDIYAGMFNLQFSGETWAFCSQSYPAVQPNGAKIWGQPKYPGFIVFNPEPQCFTDWEGFAGNGQPLATSNPSGIPDSLRFFLAHQQQCLDRKSTRLNSSH